MIQEAIVNVKCNFFSDMCVMQVVYALLMKYRSALVESALTGGPSNFRVMVSLRLFELNQIGTCFLSVSLFKWSLKYRSLSQVPDMLQFLEYKNIRILIEI